MNDDLQNVISNIVNMDRITGVDPEVYLIEECSELIKELMKAKRGKGNVDNMVEEACDVLTTVLVFLKQYDVSEDTIRRNVIFKCNRALHRYSEKKEK